MPSKPPPAREPENAFPPDSLKDNKISCKFCQRLFIPARPWQKFCSSAHRQAYHVIQRILDGEE